ncbi:MAG: GNAT family N-acetyltransferase [Leptospiraceae bacterium]|nr:GNAT family N-acetyltransferase [Leptospiraceae bacterium]MCP5499082.1 GNAT family N-acetyltransferase [Leptospiraceae bacterium]
MEIKIIEIQSNEGLEQAFQIRRKVFIEEQGVEEKEEFDEFDLSSKQFLAFYDSKPVGTARFRYIGEKVKMERFAVLKEFRNYKIGTQLIREMLERMTEPEEIYLHAQVSAIPFYEKNGFFPVGELFQEANILHRKMIYGFKEEAF